MTVSSRDKTTCCEEYSMSSSSSLEMRSSMGSPSDGVDGCVDLHSATSGGAPTPVQLAMRFETAVLARQLAQLAWAVENVPGVAEQLGAMLPFAPIVHQRDAWTCVNQVKELVIELQLAEAYRPLLPPQPSPDVPAPPPAEPAPQPSAEAGQQFVTRQQLAVQLARLQTRIEQRLRTGAIL